MDTARPDWTVITIDGVYEGAAVNLTSLTVADYLDDGEDGDGNDEEGD